MRANEARIAKGGSAALLELPSYLPGAALLAIEPVAELRDVPLESRAPLLGREDPREDVAANDRFRVVPRDVEVLASAEAVAEQPLVARDEGVVNRRLAETREPRAVSYTHLTLPTTPYV